MNSEKVYSPELCSNIRIVDSDKEKRPLGGTPTLDTHLSCYQCDGTEEKAKQLGCKNYFPFKNSRSLMVRYCEVQK